MKTTFLYIYLHSQSQSDELRWSIRSIEENFQGEAEVVIAGDRPPWYQGICLDIERSGGWFHDVHNKLLIGAQSDLVSDRFVWMMDDIYFMQPFSLIDIEIPRANRRHALPEIEKWEPQNKWQQAKKRSFLEVLKRQPHVWDFATHLPHVAEKRRVLEMFDTWDMMNGGLLFEIMYGSQNWPNPQRVKGFKYLKRAIVSDQAAEQAIGRARIFNNSVSAWGSPLRSFLKSRFRTKSPNENDMGEYPGRQQAMVDRMLKRESIRDLLHVNARRVVFTGNQPGIEYSVRSVVQNWGRDDVAFYGSAPAWFLGDVVSDRSLAPNMQPQPIVVVRETDKLDPVRIKTSRVASPSDIDVLRNGHPVVTFDRWTPQVEQWANSLFPNPCHLEVDDPSVDRSLLRYGANKWTLDCEFRGEKIDEIHGKHCPYRKELQPVFQCEKHGKCSLVELGRPGIQACNRCPVTIERVHVSS